MCVPLDELHVSLDLLMHIHTVTDFDHGSLGMSHRYRQAGLFSPGWVRRLYGHRPGDMTCGGLTWPGPQASGTSRWLAPPRLLHHTHAPHRWVHNSHRYVIPTSINPPFQPMITANASGSLTELSINFDTDNPFKPTT
ncbi:hypothetical protein RRG08_047835 [Elysia crispata]|uniref:Uncharacterized protein n=1 Tax=Elysia crispata TaxID=231223 RepID=A0AAE0ZX72_9GAST|nr:hypothetical protein RRG08_047835 [Elysia crispata]